MKHLGTSKRWIPWVGATWTLHPAPAKGAHSRGDGSLGEAERRVRGESVPAEDRDFPARPATEHTVWTLGKGQACLGLPKEVP